ncbi:DUF4019 domain-containing protein [Novosphingobium resinovorum]|uniref:DUF4019 domain-containing protein n=1 Tax=Novosphingobium resinovorum TaxID=158500 RepID=UPI002ED15E75|nr:DUF4019 domain-containing protein [Novosphingobium resinovorum]
MPFAVAAMLSGCNVKESIRDAGAEVVRFHAALDAGHSQAIWDATGADMRKATTQQQFVALLDAVHRKLGRVKSSKQVGWNSNSTTGGSFMTVTNETVFERGSGTEQFVFRKEEADKLALVGYHIQSNEMMLN